MVSLAPYFAFHTVFPDSVSPFGEKFLVCDVLTIIILSYTQLNVCLADAIHNFKWGEIIQI